MKQHRKAELHTLKLAFLRYSLPSDKESWLVRWTFPNKRGVIGHDFCLYTIQQ